MDAYDRVVAKRHTALEKARKRLHSIAFEIGGVATIETATSVSITMRIAKRRLEKAAMAFAKAAEPIYPKGRYTR